MSKENEKKWDELAQNGVLCSQPKLELTPEKAKEYINRNGFYKNSYWLVTHGQVVLNFEC